MVNENLRIVVRSIRKMKLERSTMKKAKSKISWAWYQKISKKFTSHIAEYLS